MSRITLVLLGWLAIGGASSASSPTRLYVRTFPPGARVTLDGKSLGTSDGLFVVRPGSAGIAVEADGHEREVRQVEIQPEQITRVELPLREQGQRSDRRPDGITNPKTVHGQPDASPKAVYDRQDMKAKAVHNHRDMHRKGAYRHDIVLPPAEADTPLSFQIESQAGYCTDYGNIVESMANARKIDAEAAALEVQNSIDSVDAYFKRRELNKFYRRYELDPQEREALLQARLQRAVTELHQKTAKGDVTETLNWLLQELAAPTMAHQYLPGNQTLANSALDQKLSPDDLRLIRLTDGGGKIKALTFAAGDGIVLKTDWPLALRAKEFQELCQRFEATRGEVIDEARKNGRISYENARRLREDVIALMVALEAAYPSEVRADPDQFIVYNASKRFLQGLWGSVHRAIATEDLSVFSGRLRFQGESLVALLQHMYASGLQFATSEPGGEGVYRRLFNGMRTLFVNIGSEKLENAPTRETSGALRH